MLIIVPLVFGFNLEIKDFIKGFFICCVIFFSSDIFISLNTGYYFYGDIVMNRA